MSSVGQQTYRPGIVGGVPEPPRFPWLNLARIAGVFVVLVLFAGLFYKQTFVSLSDRNAMDVAQIARNMSEGDGFSTRFVRPFNAGLPAMASRTAPFPELNHAPTYPWLVAQVFRLKPPSDQAMAWISLAFLVLMIAATAMLGRILFDWSVGPLGAAIVGTSAFVLNAATSGGEWTMLAFVFTVLLCAVAWHHKTVNGRPGAGLAGVVVAAVLLGALYSINYLMALLIVPLGVYFGITGKARRLHLPIFIALSLLLMGPLMWRNFELTGSPVLGINAWDVMANTPAYPGDTFYRSTNPGANSIEKALLFPIEHFPAFADKMMRRSHENVSTLFGMLGWLALPFAAVSVLFKFKPPQANAVRGVIYGVMPALIVGLAVHSVDSRSMIILAPVIAVFGSAYLLLLLKAKKLHVVYMRMLVGAFVLVCAFPALVEIGWGSDRPRPESHYAAERFFIKMGGSGPIYTDNPWIAAWRTTRPAVWVPRRDEDVPMLSSRGLPLQLVILTHESDSFQPDEMWYALHKIHLWRLYVTDPSSATPAVLDSLGASRSRHKIADIMHYLEVKHRSYAMSALLMGFVYYPGDPLAPDDVQIFVSR